MIDYYKNMDTELKNTENGMSPTIENAITNKFLKENSGKICYIFKKCEEDEKTEKIKIISEKETMMNFLKIILIPLLKRFCGAFVVTCLIGLITSLVLSIIGGHLTLAYFITDECKKMATDDVLSWNSYTGCFVQNSMPFPEYMTFGRYIGNIFLLIFQYMMFVFVNVILVIIFGIIFVIVIITLITFLILLSTPILFCRLLFINFVE